jgi:hypothetical protein
VSSRLGLRDGYDLFFSITVSILSLKLYGKGWEKFGGSPLNLAAPPPLFGDLLGGKMLGAKLWPEIWKMELNE